jgi:hypothetical protein
VPVGFQIPPDEFASYIETRVWESIGRVNPRPFEEAREFVRSLGIKSDTQWREYCRSGERPPDIPAAPWYTYADTGWTNMGDWFGTGYRRGRWRPFEEAREFARSLGIDSSAKWQAFGQAGNLPDDIPSYPPDVYANSGWNRWHDWLRAACL